MGEQVYEEWEDVQMGWIVGLPIANPPQAGKHPQKGLPLRLEPLVTNGP